MIKKHLFLTLACLLWIPLAAQDLSQPVTPKIEAQPTRSHVFKRIVIALTLTMGSITLGYLEWDNYLAKKRIETLSDTLNAMIENKDKSLDEIKSELKKVTEEKSKANDTIRRIGTLILNQRTLKTNYLELREAYNNLKDDIKKDYGYQDASDVEVENALGKNLKDFEDKLNIFSRYLERREMTLPVAGESSCITE